MRSPENSKAGAQAYEALLRQKLARGESVDGSLEKKTYTFEQFAWKWFDEYVIPNNKYLEQRTKRITLNSSLIPFFGGMLLEQISTHHVEQFKAASLKEGVSRKTVNNRLAILSKLLSTAYDWLELTGKPPKIAWLKCPPPRTDFLSADECTLLLSHADGMIREMILTGLRTGMRHGELAGLQWSSIDWENRNITVRHSRCPRTGELRSPKSNRERSIPMDADLYEMLFRRKKSTGYVFTNDTGQSWPAHQMLHALRDLRYKAGLRPMGWHTLRHTFASHLAMKGAPLHAIQALLGHSTIAVTMRYAHVAPSTLRTAIELLNPKQAYNGNFGQPVGNEDYALPHVESKKR
jgi:integrase